MNAHPTSGTTKGAARLKKERLIRKELGICIACHKHVDRSGVYCKSCLKHLKNIHVTLHAQRKVRCLSHYSPGDTPRCSWPGCDITDVDMLVIDHIDNDGAAHRKQLKGPAGTSGLRFHAYLIKKDFPSGFQTLCSNHNLKKELLLRRRANDTSN